MAPVRARGTPSTGGPEPLPIVIVTIAFCAVLAVVALLLRPQTFGDRVLTLAIGMGVALVILAIALVLPTAAGSSPGADPAAHDDLEAQRTEIERLSREVAFLSDRVGALDRPTRHAPQALVQGTSR